ncbi:unannotated protein [freshwater metagenome]|uniref:Unannotated protein n=1 Tax=freshwater metagenome TaxID=449393 RepID=A0A6J7B672_9ZZZZ
MFKKTVLLLAVVSFPSLASPQQLVLMPVL